MRESTLPSEESNTNQILYIVTGDWTEICGDELCWLWSPQILHVLQNIVFSMKKGARCPAMALK